MAYATLPMKDVATANDNAIERTTFATFFLIYIPAFCAAKPICIICMECTVAALLRLHVLQYGYCL